MAGMPLSNTAPDSPQVTHPKAESYLTLQGLAPLGVTLGTIEHAAGLDKVGISADGSGDGIEEWAPHLRSVTDVKLDPELLRHVRPIIHHTMTLAMIKVIRYFC